MYARAGLLAVGCLAGSSRPLAAGPGPEKPIAQYTRTVWDSSAGLPQNSVQTILQTRDGYVWLGTEEGLVRFDGGKFEVFNHTNTPALPGSDVKSLFEASDGSLWIGTAGGIARLKDGRFTAGALGNGVANHRISSVTGDRAGNIWLGTFGGGLRRFTNGKSTAFTSRDGLPNNFVWAVRETRDGTLWIGTNGGLTKMTGKGLATYTTADGLPDDQVNALLEDREGALWIGTARGLVKRRDGRFDTFTTRDGLPNDAVTALYEDAHGALWIGTDGGVSRRRAGGFDRFTTKEGLNHDAVASLTGDREGNLWIGTHGGGVTKLTDRSFSTLSRPEGLSSDVARTVLEGRDGTIWIGTQRGGLNRVKDGRVISVYTMRDGLPENTVTALLERADGSLWIGTAFGIARLHQGRLSIVRPDHFRADSIRALFEAPDGALWVGTSGGGLKILRDDQITVWSARDGLSDVVRSFHGAPDGTVWVGSDAGLSRYVNGRFETFGAAQGLFRKGVATISGDPDGTVWAGTNGDGLYRYKDGAFTHYWTGNGLFDDIVFQIVDDRRDSLWLTSNRGVSRVSRKMLVDLADGRVKAITPTAFGRDDGMRSAEFNGNAQPAGIRAGDGTLWFPTINGAVSVHPDRLVVNRLPPAVIIERLVADGHAHAGSGPIRVPPGRGELEFHFTALSFVVPAAVRLKYRLVGFDRAWVDAGRRREAHYTNLPGGSYTFQVVAQNNDGVWNDAGATLSLRLEPHFYETTLFYAGVGLTITFAIGALFRVRVRRMGQQAAALEQIVEDRTRALREEVSERRRAEETLTANVDRYKLLVETTSAVPWEIDGWTGKFSYISPQAMKLFGHDSFAVVGRLALGDLVHPDDRQRVVGLLRALPTADDPGLELDFRMMTASGRVIDVRSSVGAHIYPDGRVVLCGITLDVTLQKKLEFDLRQGQKLESVGRLAAGVAHEINTPVQFVNDSVHFVRDAMTDIAGLIEGYRRLQEAVIAGTATRELADEITEAAERADLDYLLDNMPKALDRSIDGLERVASIVRSMKVFAHPDQKEKTPVNLNQAIDSTLTIACTEYRYVATVEQQLGNIPLVTCYGGDVNQVFLNIIVNAAHAIGDVVKDSGALGVITIQTRQDGDAVVISITDTGGGIPEEARDRVFDPFFTTKELGKGTGQGLAICRSVIVEKHGGDLTFESQTGVGTTFFIRLPIDGASGAGIAA
jgi:PAS domain S-box-containing protein